MNLAALSSLPISASSLKPLELAELADTAETSTLFRIVCKQLRRVPVGSTLRETIQLAMSPEAKALRRKMTEWTEKLREGQLEPAVLVLKEYEKGRSSLRGARTLARTGEYLTWLSIPAAAASELLTGFLSAGLAGTAVGVTMATAGTMALVGQKRVEHSNRWAMYGQV
jgi:hypothetical protein